MPIFLPILLVAASIFLQITGYEKKDDHRQGLQIPIVKPLLRLWQVAEYYAANCQCLSPINPVNSLFHTTKVQYSSELSKILWIILYLCTHNGEAEDWIHWCDAGIHNDSRSLFAYLPLLFGRFFIGIQCSVFSVSSAVFLLHKWLAVRDDGAKTVLDGGPS